MNKQMIKTIDIDGSEGEGGGQILRTALALSVITGKPFHLHHIRAKRPKPGLMRQHLTCVQAAVAVGGEQCKALNDKGVASALSDQTLHFTPNPNPASAIVAGDFEFAIGSAGSCALVFQTVLWPLLMANGQSTLTLRGGTHNPMAPSFTFLELLNPYFSGLAAPYFNVQIRRHGFYPAGGGEVIVKVNPPVQGIAPIDLMNRGALLEQYAIGMNAGIDQSVLEREFAYLKSHLGWTQEQLLNSSVRSNEGPCNVLIAVLKYEHIAHVMTSFGDRKRIAEQVANQIVQDVNAYQKSAAPVGEHLADQLMIPMALAAWRGEQSQFWTTALTEHTRTNAHVIERFLPVRFEIAPRADGAFVSCSQNLG
jgi:RNA 3'-terminal phosphate cyclase (ATP)